MSAHNRSFFCVGAAAYAVTWPLLGAWHPVRSQDGVTRRDVDVGELAATHARNRESITSMLVVLKMSPHPLGSAADIKEHLGFVALPIQEITVGHLRDYRYYRIQRTPTAGPDARGTTPFYVEDLTYQYDGHRLTSKTQGRDVQARATIQVPANASDLRACFPNPFLRNIGHGAPTPPGLATAEPENPFHLAGMGEVVDVQAQDLNGVRVTRVRFQTGECWFDPALGGAVVRIVWFHPNSTLPREQTTSLSFTRAGAGPWLPSAFRTEFFAGPGAPASIREKPLAEMDVAVTKLLLNGEVPLDLFSVDLSDVVYLTDFSKTKIGAIEDRSARMPGSSPGIGTSPRIPSRAPWPSGVWVVLFAAPASGVVGFLLARRLRSRRP